MARWIPYNANPKGNRDVDCTVRAISVALDQTWDRTYAEVFLEGYIAKRMPVSNSVWRAYLRRKGFVREVVPDTCPDCYTVEDFADDHPHGVYLIGTGSHVVCIVDGNVIDTFDSRGETLHDFYYYKKGDGNG